MTTSLQRRIETLYGLERRKDKLGLDGTRALLDALGRPQTRFRSVHVAGTNGKGSVCAMVERVLREAGYRTGLYTSPHLVDFRERIRVNGRWVDEDWLEQALDRIEALPEGRDRTFFEVATALGFLYFAEQGVEIAVVEVGLGGRLDSTNVITPEVSVITTIGLDHTEILGDTIQEIAREKAGIIKPGIPVVMTSWKTNMLLLRCARERGAPTLPELRGQDATPLAGLVDFDGLRHQLGQGNLLAAIGTIEALQLRGVSIGLPAVQAGLRSVRWPGRFESCPEQPRLWWDGAHNAQGIRHLGSLWQGLDKEAPSRVVLALSRDKDVPSVIRALRGAFEPLRLILTRTRNERFADPTVLRAEASRQGVDAEIEPNVRGAIERALSATGEGEVLLTGSLFAIGEAMEAFGGAPGEQL